MNKQPSLPAGNDFDLHQTFGIRLDAPTPQDRAAVAWQLGLEPTTLNRSPDIIIRFVDRLKRSETLNYLDPQEAGFADDAFILLHGAHKTPARAQIAFDQIGQQCEIICEHGAPSVPLLVPILNMTALAKGLLPVHAAAFVNNGRGTLVAGWVKGGKTSLLLAFMARGAQFIGDEWVYIDPETGTMFGLPAPLRLKDWQLKSIPGYQSRIAPGQLNRLRVIQAARRVEQALSGIPAGRQLFYGLLNRARPMIQSRLEVTAAPQQLFGDGAGSREAPVSSILLVTSHNAPEIRVKRAEPQEIAHRIAFTFQVKQMQLLSYYHAFHFAFPQRSSPWIENAERLQNKRLVKLLSSREGLEVFYPSPVHLPALYETVCPYLQPA